MMGGWGYGDMMGGGWLAPLLMLFFGLLVLAGIALLIVWVVKGASHGSDASVRRDYDSRVGTRDDEAMAIARRRLATGEITKDQYDEILRALGT